MSIPSGIEYSLDDLGKSAIIYVDTRVFSEASILKTAYKLTDDYYIYLSRFSKQPDVFISAELRLKDLSENNMPLLEESCHDFCNILIDQEVRQIIQRETSTLRDTLVQKAFFEGCSSPQIWFILKIYQRNIDNSIYPKKAVADARMAYRDYCDISIEIADETLPKLTIKVKPKYQKNSRKIILEFWNYLLDLSCQIKMKG